MNHKKPPLRESDPLVRCSGPVVAHEGTAVLADQNGPRVPGLPVPAVDDPKVWGKHFIQPIARVMKQKGIAYLLIVLRDDGKATFVMEPTIPE